MMTYFSLGLVTKYFVIPSHINYTSRPFPSLDKALFFVISITKLRNFPI